MPRVKRRRLYTCIATILVGISILLAVFVIGNFVYIQHEIWEAQQLREMVMFHEHLYVYGDIGDSNIETHDFDLYYIPHWLIQHFHDAGGRIYLSDTWFFPVPEGMDPLGPAWGQFRTELYSFDGNPEIWVYQNAHKAFTTAHEFGHYLDYILGFPSNSVLFLEIFDKEKDAFSVYRGNDRTLHPELSNPEEFFAEFFAWYCFDVGTGQNLLMEEFPETHRFFEELIATVESHIAL